MELFGSRCPSHVTNPQSKAYFYSFEEGESQSICEKCGAKVRFIFSLTSKGINTPRQRQRQGPIGCIVTLQPKRQNFKAAAAADARCGHPLRTRLHQASASTLRRLYHDASDSVLFEINGDAWKWVATTFWRIIAELLQCWR